MARMRPELNESDLQSVVPAAEAKVYRAIRDQLDANVLVIHSLAWTYRTRRGNLAEGEADFTLFFKDAGFVTIEVKGGGISYDPVAGVWWSVDRENVRHSIKDPFRQARTERFAVLDQIKGHEQWRRWPGHRVQAGHAVFFPDLDDCTPLVGTDRPIEIIGTRKDLDTICRWATRVVDFWKGNESFDELGTLGLSLIE